MRRRLALVSALAVLVTASPGRAQPRQDQPAAATKAIDSFKEAVALFQRGEITPACRAFERSYAEDAAPGTLFNMAVCHEREGRTADAYRELDSLARRAQAAGRADNAAALDARARALRPRLARIALVHRVPARSTVVAVSMDETPLAADEWSRPLYVLPQVHVLHFRYADGSEASRSTIALRAASSTEVVMEEAPAVHVPVVAPGADLRTSPATTSGGSRAAVYATGAAGVALVAAGIVLGLRTYAERDDGEAQCRTDGGCSTPQAKQEAYDDRNAAKVDATLSTVAFLAGGAALATSVVLLVIGSSREKDAPRRLWVTPSANGGRAGLQLGGYF